MKMSQTTHIHFQSKKRVRISALACAGLLAFSTCAFAATESASKVNGVVGVQTQNTITGQWTAEVKRDKPGEIQMTYHRRSETGGFSMTGGSVPLGELQGLTSEAVLSARSNVNFNVIREAGTLACEGYFREGKGAGFWTFTPNGSFLAAMRERGYGDLTGEDAFRAAMNKLTMSFIEDLKSAGYDHIEFKHLLRAASHGVTPSFIREMQSAGYQNLTLEELVRARNHNVNGQYVKEVRAMGFDKQPLEKLIRLRNHRITQEFINWMRSAGFDNLSIDQLIRLRNHDITPEFVGGVKAEGYSNIPVETAIRLKNHAVDGGYIRRVKARGFNNLTLEQIIRLRTRDIVK
jgi:uncharacterized protein (UPF0335 family)